MITGSRGFTGGYLKSELEAAGFQVFGTIHSNKDPREGEIIADLSDRDEAHKLMAEVKPDVVAHLAAISFVSHGCMDEIYQTNILGTRNLLEGLVNCGKVPHSVLLASSANIYGNCSVEPIHELVSANPANDYAVSKLAMEHMARLWCSKLPITIVRPFNYTGVGQSVKFLLPKIVDHFTRGEKKIELGNLDVARDFSDVREVVKVYLKLLKLAPAGEIYNVCSGVAYSLKDVLEMMSDISGYSIDVKVNPDFVRENEVKRLRGSNEKLMKAVGGIEMTSLEHTLKWMFETGAIKRPISH